MAKQPTPIYEFGLYRLDVAERLLLREGRPVPLPPKVFDTLVVLVENSGRLIEKDELMKSLWPDTFVEEATLARNISDLRKALSGPREELKCIQTVPKRGYRFIATVSRLEPGELVLERHTSSRVIVEEHDERSQSSVSGLARRHPGDAIESLAVLPLANLSGDAGLDYLSDGIAESIINSLSQLDSLRVMAWSTVCRYKSQDLDPYQAGRAIGVAAALLGRLLQVSDRLVIKVELVDTGDGRQLWGEQYNRALSDIFAIEEEIASEISQKLLHRLTGEESRALRHRRTENVEAYRAYLKGRYYWNRRTERDVKRGMKFFEEAIRLDPGFALAYAGLADSYLALGSFGIGALAPLTAYPRAKQAATDALAIDESLAEAHASLGFTLAFYDWKWDVAAAHLKRAIALKPAYATAHHWYAFAYLAPTGRLDEAIAEERSALELEPLSLIVNTNLGTVLYLARRYDEAITQYINALEIDPAFVITHWMLGLAYEQVGRIADAIAEFENAIGLSARSPGPVAMLGHTYAISGKNERATAILTELDEMSRQRYVSPYRIAAIRAALGETQLALEWLDRAIVDRDPWLAWIRSDPVLDELRPLPAFHTLEIKLGLPD